VNYFFETYGCQMNSAESAALDIAIRERGWEKAESGEEADLVLLNTCSVRATAEQRVLGRIAQYGALKKKRARPLVLIIAGCMAQRLRGSLKEDYPVDFVMGPGSRALFPAILEAVERGGGGEFTVASLTGGISAGSNTVSGPGSFSFSPLHLENNISGGETIRSFVPVMHGCNNFCSYCIVPYVRGREISRSPKDILAEIELLAAAGVREITLLGQNVNSYRYETADSVITFPYLLEKIARATEGGSIGWIRFLSANPKDFSDDTIRVMAEHPVFCRHIHLCVQHGSNRILEAMNRRYTREGYLALAEKIREAMPGVSLSTDILVGFPGETEEDLLLTLDLMEEVKFLYAYMYHYNPREGTAAFKLPGRIPEDVKRERLARVIALQNKHRRELLKSRLGRRETVLIEGISRKNADELITRTARDEMAAVSGTSDLIGSFGEVTLESLKGNTFRGKDLATEKRLVEVLCPGGL
jgi:tRNA-2-methylthio-N6-dimethylallyladenosine synthase